MAVSMILLIASLLIGHILGLNDGGPPPLTVYQGGRAKEGMFPSVGCVFLMDYEEKISICTATLIDNEWAISAASCFIDPLTRQQVNFLHANFIIGEVKYTVRSEWHQESTFDVIIHEQYNTPDHENDIALLRLNRKFTTTEIVQPQKLPTTSNVEDTYEYCQLAGWGKQDDTSENTKLLYADLEITKNSNCESEYSENFNNLTMLCAGSSGSGACMGDDGGPLICTNKRSRQRELVGIVSFPDQSCQPSTAGRYTKVAAYKEWIKNKTTSFNALWIVLPLVGSVIVIVAIVLSLVYKRFRNKIENTYTDAYTYEEPNNYANMHGRRNVTGYSSLN